MIKYLGSKRRLLPVLTGLAERAGGSTALDLFTGTTRVAQAFKRAGYEVTAVDVARYSEVFGHCWISTDASAIAVGDLEDALRYLACLPGVPGYFTDTFCVQSRFIQPHNGARIDAIRDAIEQEYRDSALYPILLTSLILAADRVDSTTGVQMAYIKQWAPRSFNDLELRPPELLRGPGRTVRGDARQIVHEVGPFDIAYLDPPYNQHRYYSNYHIWETLVAWDAPEHYGVACKRIDVRDDATKSTFNRKREMPGALRSVVERVDAEIVIASYNNESWVSRDDLLAMFSRFETAQLLAFDSKRYVGAQIGIHNPQGERVGTVSHLRNLEWVIVAGPSPEVNHMTAPFVGGAAERSQATLF